MYKVKCKYNLCASGQQGRCGSSLQLVPFLLLLREHSSLCPYGGRGEEKPGVQAAHGQDELQCGRD